MSRYLEELRRPSIVDRVKLLITSQGFRYNKFKGLMIGFKYIKVHCDDMLFIIDRTHFTLRQTVVLKKC